MLLGLALSIGVNTQALTDNQANALTASLAVCGAWLGKCTAQDMAGNQNKTAIVAGIALSGFCFGYLGNLLFGGRTPKARLAEAQGLIDRVSKDSLVDLTGMMQQEDLQQSGDVVIGDYDEDLKNRYVKYVEHRSGFRDYSLLEARTTLNVHLADTKNAGSLLEKALRDDLKQGGRLSDRLVSSQDNANKFDGLVRNRLGVITIHPRFSTQRTLKAEQEAADLQRREVEAKVSAANAAWAKVYKRP